MSARKKNAYVWQQGRFEGDVEFWKHGMSESDVKPVKNGECLRLFLITDEDCQYFHAAAREKLQSQEWLSGLPEELEELEELEESGQE